MPIASKDQQHDLAYLNPRHYDDDTIDLGALLRGLFQQWNLIAAIAAAVTATGVVVALLLPNQYRIEATISQPSRQDVQPLLAQSIEPMTLYEISRTLLINLRSIQLVEAAYDASGMAAQQNQEQGTEEARFSAIRELRNDLDIEPVELTFLGERSSTSSLENVSVSLLSTTPNITQSYLNELIKRAAETTLIAYQHNVEAARDIRIAKIQSQLNTIERAAETTLEYRVLELEQAFNTAKSLGIEEPTSWETIVRGTNSGQIINLRDSTKNDLFLQGTRILQAQLDGLKRSGAARLFESPLQATEVYYNQATADAQIIRSPEVVTRAISSAELRGELDSLLNIQIDLDSVSLLQNSSLASVPANAESPNRELIAVASLVLGGFLGIFVALIRMAIRNPDQHS